MEPKTDPLVITSVSNTIDPQQNTAWGESQVNSMMLMKDTCFSHHVATLFNRTLSIDDDAFPPGECKRIASLLHASGKLASEAGELIDAIWKYWCYKKPLDRTNVIEELGDALFYIEAIAQTINVSMEEIRQANYAKLAKRYPSGYTNEAAIARADKATIAMHGTGLIHPDSDVDKKHCHG